MSDHRSVGSMGCQISELVYQWTIGPLNCRISGLSDQWTIKSVDCQISGLSDQWTVKSLIRWIIGSVNCQSNRLSDQWTIESVDCRISGLAKQWHHLIPIWIPRTHGVYYYQRQPDIHWQPRRILIPKSVIPYKGSALETAGSDWEYFRRGPQVHR